MCQCDPSIKNPYCGVGPCQWPQQPQQPRTWLGVDPGNSGALALVDEAGNLLEYDDFPTLEVRGKRRISAPLLATLVRKWNPSCALVELVGSMPKQGVASTFAFGVSAGIMEGTLATLGVSYDYVTPGVWKRGMKLSADKGISRQLAMRRWPASAHLFSRVKDDGRAEAALLAEYARTQGRLAELVAT